jgi:hypothetical protein
MGNTTYMPTWTLTSHTQFLWKKEHFTSYMLNMANFLSKFQDFTGIFLAHAEHVFLLKLQDSRGIF